MQPYGLEHIFQAQMNEKHMRAHARRGPQAMVPRLEGMNSFYPLVWHFVFSARGLHVTEENTLLDSQKNHLALCLTAE